MTCQPLSFILCRLPEKKRKKIEEIAEEMKERDREERGTEKERKVTEEIKTFPSTLTCYKDSKPCPTVSQYQLGALMTLRYTTYMTPLSCTLSFPFLFLSCPSLSSPLLSLLFSPFLWETTQNDPEGLSVLVSIISNSQIFLLKKCE